MQLMYYCHRCLCDHNKDAERGSGGQCPWFNQNYAKRQNKQKLIRLSNHKIMYIYALYCAVYSICTINCITTQFRMMMICKYGRVPALCNMQTTHCYRIAPYTNIDTRFGRLYYWTLPLFQRTVCGGSISDPVRITTYAYNVFCMHFIQIWAQIFVA